MGEQSEYGFEVSLFPRTSIEEDQVTSILFAVMDIVLPFREALFLSIGKKLRKKGNDYLATLHPSFGGKYSDKDIPDAKVCLEHREIWEALVEVKINENELSLSQLERYLERVREHKLDALITISNEICTDPNNPPLRLKSSNKNLRKIPHFHWSWRYIQSVIKGLLLVEDKLCSVDRKILNQFNDYLSHKKSTVRGFTQMPQEWNSFVMQLKDGGRPSSDVSEKMAESWFQESAEIALLLSETFECHIAERIEADSSERRLKDALNTLHEKGDFVAIFDVEGHAYPFEICLDVNSRLATFSVNHPTTEHRLAVTKIEHFLKRFHDRGDTDQWGGHMGVRLFVNWKRMKRPTDVDLFGGIQLSIDQQLKHSDWVLGDKDIKSFMLKYTPPRVSNDIQNRKKVVSLLEDKAEFFVRNYVFCD